ncbi:hypothetical protein PRUPE_2G040500 [Prunus persica]|uniref:Disease resistance RPP13-like protein 1 n=1 Tax=Prunus persica TaxID=3760 RepID=A0A251QAU1_PRUPE|nr:putative disease resistance RPP13-like protein 1 [Prunus persica]XP_020413178.1 putative disease resistance RPP13-like protein 1 [Prunus persica]XP_020413179.1 putative disease resistance RPP13-like protein 1 [Prunus persica]XP_020413180.1 putative disease resistance RPP13-like protein 1 [Prunus persica]XP_020413181.1 putative disease resistance RPP13-like protein 1 [Prunus persica]XP_020413182.1 putative disease resistance RPP13-like protein 1 [Prunus persica]XP_020413184.1 putative disea
MAGALIGGAFISASIQVICDRIASPEFVDLFRHKKLDQPLLMELKTTLLTLNAVLDDAEEKQIEKPNVREWLDELKHAVFDAEDLLDEINYEALRRKLEGDAQNGNFTSKMSTFLPTSRNKFYRRMNAKIQELLQRLEHFVQQKVALGLREDVGRKVSQRTPTTSLVHEPCVYGRDEAKQNLLEVLFDDASEENVSVIPIVGMGGVGKTTLARMLYNDNKVKEHFTLKAWACVSEDYDAIRVTKTLLESVTSKPCKKTDLNLLQVELSEELRGKKFLFVLDDLWNEKYTDWNYLQTPFTSGARGSKVLVTTRNKNIASFMQNVPIHTLKPLSHEDCWFLLAKHANVISSSDPSLEEIGKKIARKCNGLPLAAQTLGGVLRSRPDSEVWTRVLNSNIWELPYEKSDILPALGLSYHYLPAKLKRCFIYCSIFPKDYVFKVENVVFLWMAEGLIPQAENGDNMEEVAKEYFDELLSRSLFQTSGKSSFVMHDLINDLAVFMSKGFCSRWEGRESHEVERVRHLSYAKEKLDVAVKFEPLKGAKCLRTFLSISLKPYYRYINIDSYYVSKKVLHNLLASLTCLRVLSLSCYENVTELPDSIKKLIHLRYLDLSDTAIETLPSVLCSLYNLQTLLLSTCSRLVELPADLRKLINLQKLMLGGCTSLTKLPVDMCELNNLHHLDFSGTKIVEMPRQMSTLKSLRTLSAFTVGKSTGSTIGELGKLPHLGGKLSILQLRNIVDTRDALQANLKDKKDLKELELAWGDEDADDSQREKDVLEKLQPCVNLEKLTISGYGGKHFPNWLGGSSLSNIQVMCISDCSNCSSLPSVGRLPNLKELCISQMKLVKTIGVEFYGSNGSSVIQPFKSLEKLEFHWMAEWEEWVPSGSGGVDFPCLQELILRRCPKLRGSLPCDLPRLKKFRVEWCGVLYDQRATTATSVKMDYKSLEELRTEGGLFDGVLSLLETKLLSTLEIWNLNDIQCLPNINRLQSLRLTNCPTLSSFPEDGLPTTLTLLVIDFCSRLELPHEMLAKLTSLGHLAISHSCDSMRSFPLGIFPKLTWLFLCNFKNLESLSLIEGGGVDENLSHLNITRCPNLVCFPRGGLPTPNLTELEFIGCKKLKSLPERIHTLTALRGLKMDDLPNLESIAEDGGLPPNLTELEFIRCKKLKSLPERIHTLTRLRSLKIRDLPNLESIAEDGGLPHNLRHFCIKNCERLRASSVAEYWGLRGLVSLEEFEIGGRGSDEILETLLKQQLLPKTLQRLEISRLSSLKSLDAKGLKHLTSLSFLSISNCSALEKRYKKKTGKAWADISHIPCIKIGKEVII